MMTAVPSVTGIANKSARSISTTGKNHRGTEYCTANATNNGIKKT